MTEPLKSYWILYHPDEDYQSYKYHGVWTGHSPEDAINRSSLPTNTLHAYAVLVGSGVKFQRGGWSAVPKGDAK